MTKRIHTAIVATIASFGLAVAAHADIVWPDDVFDTDVTLNGSGDVDVQGYTHLVNLTLNGGEFNFDGAGSIYFGGGGSSSEKVPTSITSVGSNTISVPVTIHTMHGVCTIDVTDSLRIDGITTIRPDTANDIILKKGSGTLDIGLLSCNIMGSSPLEVDAGKVLLASTDNAGKNHLAAMLTINDGGILATGIGGTVINWANGGNITVKGIFAPGDAGGIGMVSFAHVPGDEPWPPDSGVVNFGATAVFALDIIDDSAAGVSYDAFQFTGRVSERITDTLALNIYDGAAISINAMSADISGFYDIITLSVGNLSVNRLDDGVGFVIANTLPGTGEYEGWFVDAAYAYKFTYGDSSVSLQIEAIVPEPASLTLLGLGAMGLLARRRR